MKSYTTIDEYIQGYPANTQKLLHQIRATIQEAAPDATEKISYGIPTFFLKKNLVHFGAYEQHIGFYPGSKAIQVFKKEMKAYKLSKGTVQFPLTDPLPLDLIKKIVEYRVVVNLSKKTLPHANAQ